MTYTNPAELRCTITQTVQCISFEMAYYSRKCLNCCYDKLPTVLQVIVFLTLQFPSKMFWYLYHT